MSKSHERKVKSLNDIPKIFKSCEQFRLEIPFKNVVEQFGKLNETNRNIYLSYQIIPAPKNLKNSGSSNVSDFHRVPINSEKDSDTEKELKECDEQLENCTEINPLGDANVSREFSEERNFTRILRKSLKRNQKQIVWTIDTFLSLFIIAPVSIAFWHSTWTYINDYTNMFHGLIAFIFGILIHTCFALAKDSLHVRATNAMRKKSLLSKIFCKIAQISYTYVFSLACNTHWWGGFIIYDYFFSDIWIIVAATVTIMTILIILRAIRNLLAVPFIITVDKLAYAFRFPTRYRLID
ncbi:uncharacterized protein LOC113464295 [Ceratina calcarata]|uniref:Uncharacterized protein LOC113464295 n=1 Tax=Ceratina calcarata TaxID=156304 RepID=A0AAJ7S0E6_9HYME|nr:uncharacterized protein LOC113464295 [Ceratina calcarata]